ncbi:MAG: bi-domain-containing oxidoreductase [Acidobacteriota bacterium]
MKQVIQNYKTGELQLVDVPPPALKKGCLLIQNLFSLVSVGTEKNILEMAKKSLLGKAMARPDLVKKVIAMAQIEGILETYKAAMARLDNPVPLGYSSAGVVLEAGAEVEGFSKGDRVACAGSEFASHAEIVCIPENLCVKLPDDVDFESGSFVALGGIALQAVRLANSSLGDRVAVIGLGLLGQITVQILRSAGCHVFAIDISEEKVKRSIASGAEKGFVSGKGDIFSAARDFAPQGFDSIIIMAATESNEPLELASEIARERARIIAAGLVGLDIPRKVFFEKELELVVSRAWGPGVFDPLYIDKNRDYPYSYVRWTAKRNMEEFIAQIASGGVSVRSLLSHRFSIDRALEAYDLILKGKEPFMGVVLEYPQKEILPDRFKVTFIQKTAGKEIASSSSPYKPSVNVGLIGAGLFATGTVLPNLKSLKDVHLRGIAEATGIKGQHTAKKFHFDYFTTDYKDLLKDEEVHLIFVLTRHGAHAHFVSEALKAGKNVFTEKPLCINEEQLQGIITAYRAISSGGPAPIVMVGFNRRFSPFSIWLKEKFRNLNEPLSIHCTVNAGFAAANHWVHDPEDGAGRIIGEVCHFIDLIQYFTDSVASTVYAETLRCQGYKESDNVSISIKMANGSIASILYVASGDKRYPRERVEIFGGGSVGVIENFKKALHMSGGRKKILKNLLSVDRGHRKEIQVLIEAIKEKKTQPIPLEEYISTTLTTFAVEKSLREGAPFPVRGLAEDSPVQK